MSDAKVTPMAALVRGVPETRPDGCRGLRTVFGVRRVAHWEDGVLVGLTEQPWKVLQEMVGLDEQGRPLYVNVPAFLVDGISEPPEEGVTYL